MSFGVNSIAASQEDEQMIKDLQTAAVLRDPTMAAANIASAQSDAMRAAAANPNGAMAGFMGMGMAGGMGGMNASQLFAAGQAQQQTAPQPAPAPAPAPAPTAAPAAGAWTCSCGATNTGKFCSECGSPAPAPAPAKWFCPNCGSENGGKVCSNCGTPRP